MTLDHTFLTTVRVRRARSRVLAGLPIPPVSRELILGGQLLELTVHGRTVGVLNAARDEFVWLDPRLTGIKKSEVLKLSLLCVQLMDAAQCAGLCVGAEAPEAAAPTSRRARATA